jgi:hypothetical protein
VSRALAAAVAILTVTFCLIYVPDIGHGFIRDDFHWIVVGRVASLDQLANLLTADVGFYRPVVLASFAANYTLSGLQAFPFALTNLLLLGACAVLLAQLATALGLGPSAGALAAAAWAFNLRAVGMAVLWISGRTALFLTLFNLLAALAVLRRQRWAAAGWCLLAMLSKEEAVTLPIFLAAWVSWSSDTAANTWRSVFRFTWPLLATLPVYAVLRAHSNAFGPLDAPSYYQFTFAPGHLLRNVFEYLDRSSTVAAALMVILTVSCRHVPSLDRRDRRALVFGAAWLIFGFAITVFLPLRSDLYALAPSAGSCLVIGVVADASSRRHAVRYRRALAVLVLLPLLLLPIYRVRNGRWVRPADLSTRILNDLHDADILRPLGPLVVLIDSASEPTTIESAFESLLPDAAILIGIRGRVELVGAGEKVPIEASDVFRLVGGRLQRVR